MIGDLIVYAVVVLAVPVVYAEQKLHDWWSNPTRAFYRRVWIAEHLRLTPLSRRSRRDRAHRHRADGDSPRLVRAGGTQRAACHAHNATPEGGSAQAVVPPSDGLGLKQPVGVGMPPDSTLAGSQKVA